MGTIAENLQIIKDATIDIKQAIIDKGGVIEGDITTWADAIRSIKSEDPIKVFYVDGMGEFQYEAGMTWEEFINSEYNNDSFMSVGSIVYTYVSGRSLHYTSFYDGNVSVGDVIAENFTYYQSAYGGAS